MLAHSINKENTLSPTGLKSPTRSVFSHKTSNALQQSATASTPGKTTTTLRKKVGRASNIHRAEKVAAVSLSASLRRARTLSPPVSKVWAPLRMDSPATPTPTPLSDVVSMDMDMDIDLDLPTRATTASPTMTLQLGRYRLPSRLLRPVEKEHPMELLTAISEDLADVPLEYTRDSLLPIGSSMLQALKLSKIQLPTTPSPESTSTQPAQSGLEKELEVTIDPSIDITHAPSHILALFSRRPSSLSTSSSHPSTKVTLHLTHALPLAAHCSSLPPSTFSPKGRQTVEESTPWTLPVIPLALPDSSSWGILMGYLYTKNVHGLLSSLLPIPSRFAQPTTTKEGEGATPTLDIPAISTHLAHTYSAPSLASLAQKIHGLWANAITLGIYDDDLWDIVDLCWLVVIEAFKKIAVKEKGKGKMSAHP